MKIEILSHRALIERTLMQRTPCAIFISEPENPFAVEHTREALAKIPHTLMLFFDDLWGNENPPTGPTRRHVRAALEFARGHEELVVSCRMGVSRSSAIGFGIMVERTGLRVAFAWLNNACHSPNPLVIDFIQEELKLPYLKEAMEAWKKGDTKEYEYYVKEHEAALRRREAIGELEPIRIAGPDQNQGVNW